MFFFVEKYCGLVRLQFIYLEKVDSLKTKNAKIAKLKQKIQMIVKTNAKQQKKTRKWTSGLDEK